MIALQEKLVNLNRKGEGKDYLLLLEHPPTYTVGQRVKQYEQQKQLEDLGAKFYYTKRGGDITFHGNGQLVGYPIMDLQKHKIGVREYVHRIEEVLIETCRDFDISASRTSDTGVWVGANSKIAAIGIQVQRHITSHGFALNCDTDLAWFDKIIPCGLEGKVATSLTRETGRQISIEMTLDVLQRKFEKLFELQLEHVSESKLISSLISADGA